MILIFGGTTEGRKAAEVLEESGSAFYYSTKTGEQDITLHHGTVISGAMDKKTMTAFVSKHEIQTIGKVSADLQIPVVRYERIYPPRDSDITWIDDYSDLDYILPSLSREGQGVGRLLATTGVQSIGKLKHLEAEGIKVIYRILNRESSIVLAHQQGASDNQLCYYDDGDMPIADTILMKESGISGGFIEKVNEARRKNMRIIAIKRPEGFMAHGLWFMVNGPHGLRRMVEKLLPEFFPASSLFRSFRSAFRLRGSVMDVCPGAPLPPFLRRRAVKCPSPPQWWGQIRTAMERSGSLHSAAGS